MDSQYCDIVKITILHVARKSPFDCNLQKHSRIIPIRSSFARPAILSYSGQKKDGKDVFVYLVCSGNFENSCTVSQR